MSMNDVVSLLTGPIGGWIVLFLLCLSPLLISLFPMEFLMRYAKFTRYNWMINLPYSVIYIVLALLITYNFEIDVGILLLFPIWVVLYIFGISSLKRTAKRISAQVGIKATR